MILAFLISWLIVGATVTAWWMIERGIHYRHYYGFSITSQVMVVLTLTGPIYMWWSASNRPAAADDEGGQDE